MRAVDRGRGPSRRLGFLSLVRVTPWVACTESPHVWLLGAGVKMCGVSSSGPCVLFPVTTVMWCVFLFVQRSRESGHRAADGHPLSTTSSCISRCCWRKFAAASGVVPDPDVGVCCSATAHSDFRHLGVSFASVEMKSKAWITRTGFTAEATLGVPNTRQSRSPTATTTRWHTRPRTLCSAHRL